MPVALDWRMEPPWSPCLPPAPWSQWAEAPSAPHFIWLLTQASTRIPGGPGSSKTTPCPGRGQLHFQMGAVRGQGQGGDVRVRERRAQEPGWASGSGAAAGSSCNHGAVADIGEMSNAGMAAAQRLLSLPWGRTSAYSNPPHPHGSLCSWYCPPTLQMRRPRF